MKNISNNTGMWLFLAAIVFGCCLVVASAILVFPQIWPAIQTWSVTQAVRYPIMDDLIAYYPFNGNADDESGNGHHGRVYGAALATNRFGAPESAYYFDGRNDYIQTNVAASHFSGDFTVAAWVKFNNFDNAYPHILCGDHYFIVFHGMGPAYRQQGHVAFYQQTSTDYVRNNRMGDLVSDNALQTGKWHLIAVTKDDLRFSMFVDNVLQAEEFSEYGIRLTGETLYIGADIPAGGQPSGYLDGYLDDLRIYDRVLSDQEIRKLYSEDGWSGR